MKSWWNDLESKFYLLIGKLLKGVKIITILNIKKYYIGVLKFRFGGTGSGAFLMFNLLYKIC